MVLLRNLNGKCFPRKVATSAPAQIACRLFGNEKEPCFLDRLCIETEKRRISLFYGATTGALVFGFFSGFWFLRITRFSKVLGFLGGLFFPPLCWALSLILAGKRLLDSLDA